jgi:hypothetical protein
MGDRKKPTKKQIARFQSAAKKLAKLGEEGCMMFMAEDSLHLMKGETHDTDGRPLQENSVASERIPGADAGCWL